MKWSLADRPDCRSAGIRASTRNAPKSCWVVSFLGLRGAKAGLEEAAERLERTVQKTRRLMSVSPAAAGTCLVKCDTLTLDLSLSHHTWRVTVETKPPPSREAETNYVLSEVNNARPAAPLTTSTIYIMSTLQ